MRIREAVERALVADEGLSTMGLAVTAVRIASIKPTPDLEKALEAPTRERIQQESDEAAFARRALAVEKERAIQENALTTKIELAKREEDLIRQQGQNTRRDATEKAEAERICAEGTAARSSIESTAEAHRICQQGEANATSIRLIDGVRVDLERAKMAVYRDLPPAVLFGLAAQNLATKLTRIDHLSLSPDTLGPVLSALLQAGTRKLEQEGSKGR